MAYQPTDWEHGDIITGGKLNKIEQELTHVADNATYGFGGAQLSSDGLTPFSYINAGDPMPANPQKGDTVFLKDGNDFLIYSYNGEDWVLKIDPDLSNRIEETIKTASDNTDKAIADNNTQINETINQVAKEQADLAVKDGDFNNKAQAMADKALADAKANTTQVAQDALNSANQNIADAKKSLTDSIANEASDRASAVGALDTKAQGYADTAKKNAIDVATSADGVINKKIDDTVSSFTSTVSQNKKDAEGKITTAQSTATQALTGLSSKVDTSTYNAKTGQLSTDVTNVTQTANQAKTDIASIKQTDTTQDARMTTIEADANGTKTTVSNLQKTQNTQSGSISTLQQRADGFDATVTKVDNLAVGGRNYVLNSNVSTTSNITGFYSSVPSSYFNNKQLTVSVQVDYDNITALSALNRLGVEFVILNKDGSNRYIGSWKYPAIGDSFHGRIYTTWDFSNNEFKDYANNQMGQGIYVQGPIGTNVSVSKPKLEIGTSSTDWNPAPEDLSSATAKAQLKADEASAAVTKLTNADGIITKAQADIKANADAITQKVSKTVYDKNTGDLTQAISKAQSTADGAVSTVGNYQTSNDKRVKAAESTIEQHTKDITARVSQTDYDNNNSQLNTRFTKVEATADGASTTVGKLNTTVNNLGQLNRLLNTEFNPDYAAWTAYGNVTTLSIDRYWLQNGSNNLGVNRNQDQSNYGYAIQKIAIGQNTTFSFSVYAKINSMISSKGRLYIHLRALDANGNMLSDIYKSGDKSTTNNFENFSVQNAQTPAGTTVVELAMGMYGGGSVSFNHPFFILDSHIGNYVAGNYSNSDYLAQVKITADGVSSIVSDPTKGLSFRVQTAEGTLNTVKSTADGAMSKASQTANDITQEIKDRTTGDSNTLQSSKDFTQSSVSSAVNGVNSTITQTSDSLIAKINTKTDSDTVLSLLKNNWSIGITDNISKITSGIVGNASQMSLISKNVTIDSPSTQITGTAWINSAMIQDGSIVNANIADAAITSAKIAQLDVAKLTGNVSSFIQSNWNGTYGSTTITSSGLSVQSGSMTTLFDSSGAHFTQGTRTAQYSFGNWIDNQGALTTSTGLGIGLTGDNNSFINIIESSGSSVALVAGVDMEHGANKNIVRGAINLFADTNIRSRLLFVGNDTVKSTYIEADETKRTMNFYTDNAKDGNGNWFWFNHKVLSTGTFSSTSLLSKKNVIADYEEDALGEISKTDIVEFEYKNDVGEKHISPIIDDVNDEKDYYIPKTILGENNQYVDMYSMISMAWKAIQQLNEKIER